MKTITYYVASSIDGFIAGPNDDISGFLYAGKGVDQYKQDLLGFDVTIMGRKTYEFGYKYGLEPGQPAYPHMQHYIFSNSLTFENPSEKVKVCQLDVDFIKELKKEEGTGIYLCGGGQFAAWLLRHQLIDILKIKLNPVVLGNGVRLFGDSSPNVKLKMLAQESYDDGLQLLTYAIQY